MKASSKALFATCALTASVAHAGWTSGGGELIRDARNPWFLENTKTVEYCVEIDEANFGLGRGQVEAIIRQTLENWKLDFAETTPATAGSNGKDLRIATQNFSQVPCADSVQLRFQFGVLTGEQLSRLGDPTKYVGISVRTDYDTKQMQGKGFIYISPSRGPLKFESKDAAPEPWSMENGALLYGVLLHEVGHIFGLTHSTEFGVMNERFSETLVNARSASSSAEILKGFPQFHVFKYPENSELLGGQAVCGASAHVAAGSNNPKQSSGVVTWREPLKSFYGIPNDVRCISFSLKNNKFLVKATRENGDTFELGAADLVRKDPWGAQESALSVYFPEEQVVYPGVVGLRSGPWMQGRTIFKGTYKTTDGKIAREIGITAQPFGLLRISGIFNGHLLVDIGEGI